MKRAYLIHGWEGNPNNSWFPWLKQSLEEHGFEVHALAMPDPTNPDPVSWPQTLLDEIKNPDEKTCLVGHSIGCQTILRYIEKLPAGTRVGKVILVAPFFKLTNLETQTEKDLWNKWGSILVNTELVKEKANRIVSIFSDDDPDVDHDVNAPMFKTLLNSKIILEHGKGHFGDDSGTIQLPIVLEEVLN